MQSIRGVVVEGYAEDLLEPWKAESSSLQGLCALAGHRAVCVANCARAVAHNVNGQLQRAHLDDRAPPLPELVSAVS